MKKTRLLFTLLAAALFALTAVSCTDNYNGNGGNNGGGNSKFETLEGTQWIATTTVLTQISTTTLHFTSKKEYKMEITNNNDEVISTFTGTYMYDHSSATVMMSEDGANGQEGDTMTGRISGDRMTFNIDGEVTVFTKR